MFRQMTLYTWARMCWLALVAGVLATVSVTQAQAQTYKVRPGDTLRIEVLEDASLNRTVLVAPDGRISVPTAGTLRASGQSIEGIKRIVTNRLASNFANEPNVFVSIEGLVEPRAVAPTAPSAPATISVYVMGEASKPGKLEVSPGTNVLQMFAVMGGFTNFAATKRVQLRRTDHKTGQQTMRTLNYKSIEAGGSGGQVTLQDGDIIVVPQRRLFE